MKELDIITVATKASGISITDYQYFHQLFEKRTIILNKEIEEDLIETVYLPLRDFEADDSEKPVTLILNSLGGSVADGFFLANYLSNYSKKLDIIVTGQAASMAAVILSAGGKNPNITRYCYPSTYGLIHDGYVALSASETKTAADIMAFNERVDADIRQFILDNTKITPEQYDSKTRHQWFLNSKELKEYGLIDVILGETV